MDLESVQSGDHSLTATGCLFCGLHTGVGHTLGTWHYFVPQQCHVPQPSLLFYTKATPFHLLLLSVRHLCLHP